MTYSTCLNFSDYPVLADEIANFDTVRELLEVGLDTEHRAWESALALRAVQERGCETVLVLGGHQTVLPAIFRDRGLTVTYLSSVVEMSALHFTMKYDAIVALSVLEHVDDPNTLYNHLLDQANKVVVITTDCSANGQVYTVDQKRTYTPPMLWQLFMIAEYKGWRTFHRPYWGNIEPLVEGAYSLASLCLYKPQETLRPYDLTLCSIMRNSMPYLPRYQRQVHQVLEQFNHVHLIVVEGDSTDQTRATLEKWRDELTMTGHTLDVIRYDTGAPMIGSVDHSGRWINLERCWNEALWHVEPLSGWVVCVESDLIWDWAALRTCMDTIENLTADVVCPLLMSFSKEGWFHDINGFVDKVTGENFTNEYPWAPAWDGLKRYIPLVTGGGMLVCHAEALSGAEWHNKCRLHFRTGLRMVADMHTRIYHP